MKIYLAILLISLNSFAEISTEQYLSLEPYHETLYEPYPEQVCKRVKRVKKECHFIIKKNAMPQKFKTLLKQTENENTIDDAFLKTKLGIKYQKLKNFMAIYDKLQKCKSRGYGKEYLDQILKRVEINSSLSNIDTQCYVQQRVDSLKQVNFFNDFNKKLLSKESLVSLIQLESINLSQTAKNKFIKKYKNKEIADTDGLKDINQKIHSLNDLLNNYHNKKIILEQKHKKELKELSFNKIDQLKRSKKRRELRKKLLQLKQDIYSQYQQRLASLHGHGAGDLLQTELLRKKTGIEKLEEQSPKLLGLAGFENDELVETDAFKTLTPITLKDYKSSISELFERVSTQISELKKDSSSQISSQKLLTKYLHVSPLAIGTVLINYPQFTDQICNAAKEVATKTKNKEILSTSTYIVAGTGIAIAGIATLGGALPASAVIMASIGALSFTAGDYMYQRSLSNEAYQKRAAILNAYLAEMGDKKSAKEIQDLWVEKSQADYTAKLTLGLGAFDLLAIPSAARIGTLTRLTGKMGQFDRKLSKNRKLLNMISQSNKYTKLTQDLLASKYSKESIGKYLALVATLSKSDQIKTLDNLIDAHSGNYLNPFYMSSLLKGKMANKELIEDLKSLGEELALNYVPNPKILDQYFTSGALHEYAFTLEVNELRDLEQTLEVLHAKNSHPQDNISLILDNIQKCKR